MDFIIALIAVALLAAGAYALYKRHKQESTGGAGTGGGPGITPDEGDRKNDTTF
jgi:hypothetical protein